MNSDIINGLILNNMIAVILLSEINKKCQEIIMQISSMKLQHFEVLGSNGKLMNLSLVDASITGDIRLMDYELLKG